jgi:hypothetical protein
VASVELRPTPFIFNSISSAKDIGGKANNINRKNKDFIPNGKRFAKKLRKPARSKGAKTAHLIRECFCNFCKPILFRYSFIITPPTFEDGGFWQNLPRGEKL